MTFTWRPKWRKIVIEDHGIKISTAYDEVSGLHACPLCINIEELILLNKAPPEKIPLFYNVTDLIYHILTHRKQTK